MEKLVSILTSCYNGGEYIDRYAEALLKQDYDNCQLIIIDDGSTDDSRQCLWKYRKNFEEKGFSFEYYYHENLGIGESIAHGIQYVKGEYFIWPDIDDMLTPDSIRKKVELLEKRPELGAVRTDFMVVSEANLNEVIEFGAQKYHNKFKEDLFLDYMFDKNMWLQPGCYMIRMSYYDQSNPDRYIFPTRAGQNWQILLPILYKYRCGYIDEPLYIYVLHKGSLSDQVKGDFQKKIIGLSNYETLKIETLKHMNVPVYKELVTKLHIFYLELKLGQAFEMYQKNQAIEYYTELKTVQGHTYRNMVKAYGSNLKLVHFLIELRRRFKNGYLI